MTVNRYLSAILSTAVVILTAWVAIPDSAWQLGSPAVAGFVALAASTVIGYLVPLAPGKWPGLFKTGVAILAAVFAAVWPLLSGQTIDWAVVALAGLNAVVHEVGVNIRVDDPTLAATAREAGSSAPVPSITTPTAQPAAPASAPYVPRNIA